MSRVLAVVGLATVGLFLLFLVGYWVIPRLALCMAFCWVGW